MTVVKAVKATVRNNLRNVHSLYLTTFKKNLLKESIYGQSGRRKKIILVKDIYFSLYLVFIFCFISSNLCGKFVNNEFLGKLPGCQTFSVVVMVSLVPKHFIDF